MTALYAIQVLAHSLTEDQLVRWCVGVMRFAVVDREARH